MPGYGRTPPAPAKTWVDVMSKDTPAPPSQNVCFDGGTQKYDDDAVQVSTGATYSTLSSNVADPTAACSDPSKTATAYTDGISIKIKCKKNPHLIQFIYREIIKADGTHDSQSITTSGGTYNTTTDPAKPNWNTDSAAKPSPYYEDGGVHRTDDGGLTTFDQPGLMPGRGETWRATFKAYAICDGKVVREITWVREQVSGSPPTYTVGVAKASDLPDWAKQQMKTNGYDSKP
jgi:hypothetical protein